MKTMTDHPLKQKHTGLAVVQASRLVSSNTWCV